METIIYLLLVIIIFTLAAAVNYRRSVLKAQQTVRLHKEAEQSMHKAQQEYKAALQARLEAEQAREEAYNELERVQQYWTTKRPN